MASNKADDDGVNYYKDMVLSPGVEKNEMSVSYYFSEWKRAWLRLAEEQYICNIDKGFYDTPKEFAVRLALIHSELSEALEADRCGNPASEKIPQFNQIEEELADCVLRIMDTSFFMGLDVGGAIEAKLKYNKTRTRMHGGKKY